MEKETFHLGRLAFDNAKRFGDKIAYKYRKTSKDAWKGKTWNEVAKEVRRMAKAFIAFGLKEGDKVAIFAQNMSQTIIVDLAAQAVRAVSVPLYATSSAEQVEYIVKDSECRLIFAGEQYQYNQSIIVSQRTGNIEKVVMVDEDILRGGADNAITIEDFAKYGDDSSLDAELDKRQSALSREDLATLIYTSGTSGEPKGVMICHYNYEVQMYNHKDMFPDCDETKTSVMFLPCSHIFERAWDYYCFYRGMMIYVNTNPKEVTDCIKSARPNYMCSVPRFWEKVYAGILEKVDKFSYPMRKLMYHAIEIGRRRNIDYIRNGKDVPMFVELQYNLFDKTLFRIVKKAIGMENMLMLPVAGAALSVKVCELLKSIGLNIVGGYGLTESTATVSCFDPKSNYYDMSSIGVPIPGLQVKISDEGEILLKGDSITKGYYNKPEVNAVAFTDGWFHTGDAGRLENGILYMTERIKDLFKTSNGKYIAPQQIETILVADKYIEQCVVIGDGRKFVSALIVPTFETLKDYAAEQKIAYTSEEDLVKNQKIIDFYEGRLKSMQTTLAAYEQVKRFTLLSKGFTTDNGELTLTLKVKRKVVNEHYADLIEKMYAE